MMIERERQKVRKRENEKERKKENTTIICLTISSVFIVNTKDNVSFTILFRFLFVDCFFCLIFLLIVMLKMKKWTKPFQYVIKSEFKVSLILIVILLYIYKFFRAFYFDCNIFVSFFTSQILSFIYFHLLGEHFFYYQLNFKSIMSSIIILQHSRQLSNADVSCTYLIKPIFAKVAFRNATGSSVVEPAVEPDHPERHDLWEPVVIARDSALTENICVGLSDCVRARVWPNIFICGRKGGKERKEEERKAKEEEMATECMHIRNNGSDWEKWTVMARREERASKYLRMHVYAWKERKREREIVCVCRGPPAHDVLFRSTGPAAITV